MEIGLTAKVKPELDEKASDRQASKLQEKFEDAVSDLPATMKLDKVIDKTEEMKKNVESAAESMEKMADTDIGSAGGGGAGMSMDGQGAPDPEQMPDQGGGVGGAVGGMAAEEGASRLAERGAGRLSGGAGSGAGKAAGRQKMAKGIGKMSGKLGGISSKLTGVVGRLGGVIAGLGTLGTVLLAGAAAIAVVGFAALALSKIWDGIEAMAKHSPLLAQVVDMIGMAMSLFFRPFANLIGQALLPVAATLIRLAANFNRVFGNKGILTALSWLAKQIVVGTVQAFWAAVKWLAIELPMFILENLPQILALAVMAALYAILAPAITTVAAILGGILLVAGFFGKAEETWDLMAEIVMTLYDILVWGFDMLISLIVDGLMWILMNAWDLLKLGMLPFLIFAFFAMQFFQWLWDNLQPVISWFQDPYIPFDALGDILGGALDLGSMAIDELISGTISLGEWMWDGAIGLGEWMWDGAVGLGQWMWSGAVALGQWVWSGAVALGQWLWSGAVGLGQWLWSGAIGLGQWLWSGAVGLGQWLWSGAIALGQWLWSGAVMLGQWLWSGAIALGQWLWSGAIALGQWLFSGAIDIANGFIQGAIDIASGFVQGAIDIASGFVQGAIDIANGFIQGAIDIAEYVTGTIQGAAESAVETGQAGIDFVNPMAEWHWTGFAEGGIVDAPTRGIVGEGGETEAIMPLSKLQNFIDTPEMGGAGQTITVDVSAEMGDGLTENDIRSAVRSAISGQLDSLEASMDDIVSEIRRSGLQGPIQITADGKVIAELGDDGTDKYKRSREVNR